MRPFFYGCVLGIEDGGSVNVDKGWMGFVNLRAE
ncbi:MAG: hypothetical protein RLZZ146_980 [Bacteroidota bacterium]